MLVLVLVCWGVLGLVLALMLVGHVGSVALLMGLLLMLVMNERCGGLCGLGLVVVGVSKPRHVEVFNTTIALLFPALLLLSSGWLK